jgi:DNA-binding response OmpR family regulator
MHTPPKENPILRVLDLEIDTFTKTVRRSGQPILLTPREYALLELLARRRGKVVSRAVIWDRLFRYEQPGVSSIITLAIASLRKKIDRGFDPPLILTRRRRGYMVRGD